MENKTLSWRKLVKFACDEQPPLTVTMAAPSCCPTLRKQIFFAEGGAFFGLNHVTVREPIGTTLFLKLTPSTLWIFSFFKRFLDS